MFLVLIANLLSVAFAFMINDVADARDDASDKLKAVRNPVSAGRISSEVGYIASFMMAFISAIIFCFLGTIPFLLGIINLVLSAFYSLKLIRLKGIPLFDLLSHGLILAGFQLLCAYFTLVPELKFNLNWILPFLFVMAISIRGQLFNQIRDFECDRKAGIRHTTAVVGIARAHYLMTALLTAAGIIFISCLAIGIIPFWVFLLIMLLGVILLRDPVTKFRGRSGLDRTLYFQKPMLIIGSISLAAWTISSFF